MLKRKYLLLVTAALRHDLSAADLAVLAAMVERFNNVDGAAWPSLACMVKDTGRDRATVKRAVLRLEKAGMVEVIYRGGRSDPNRYRPCFEIGVAMPLKRADDSLDGGRSLARTRGRSDAPGGGRSDAPLTHSISTHSSKPRDFWLQVDAQLPSGADRFKGSKKALSVDGADYREGVFNG